MLELGKEASDNAEEAATSVNKGISQGTSS
jgi:hypothetical protein